MPRVYWRGAVVDFAFCRASQLDLAVPSTPQTLPQIMQSYPLAWRRASNANYLSGTGPEGIVAERGTLHESTLIGGRPSLFVSGDRVWFTYHTYGAEQAQSALGGGPMLLEGGHRTDIWRLLQLGRFEALSPDLAMPRVAIGVTATGLALHVVAVSLSLFDLADFMAEQGCTDAMNLDGGRSAGLMEDSAFRLGYRNRTISSALVMRELVEVYAPAPVIRTVMLDPGHGQPDPGAVGVKGIVEADVVLDISQRIKTSLERANVNVLMTREGRTGIPISERIAMSNREKPEALVMIHCNAASQAMAEGVETFYWHSSQEGRRLASLLMDTIVQKTAFSRRAYTPRAAYAGLSGYFQGLRLAESPATIIGCGFLTNAFDAAYLSDFANRSVVAQAISDAIISWLG